MILSIFRRKFLRVKSLLQQQQQDNNVYMTTATHSDYLSICCRFQELLVEVGFQDGQPIDEEFYRQHISGRHNPEIAADLFPDWPEARRTAFYEEKEQRFRNMAGELHFSDANR